MAMKKTTTKKAAGSKKAEAAKPKGKAGNTPRPAAPKAKANGKPKRIGALDAAVKVLGESKQPLNCKQMVEAMAAEGLWSSPGGKTPHATLYSAILREMQNKGKDARFIKAERGKFSLAKGA